MNGVFLSPYLKSQIINEQRDLYRNCIINPTDDNLVKMFKSIIDDIYSPSNLTLQKDVIIKLNFRLKDSINRLICGVEDFNYSRYVEEYPINNRPSKFKILEMLYHVRWFILITNKSINNFNFEVQVKFKNNFQSNKYILNYQNLFAQSK